MRLIDADTLLNAICGCFNVMEAEGIDMTTARAIVISVVNHVPAVDAVSVVRCKDCKHYMTIYCTCDGCCISPDWYCASGERRDTDGKDD